MSMKKVCDGCGKELKEYYMTLTNNGKMVNFTKDFCNVKCLKKYLT